MRSRLGWPGFTGAVVFIAGFALAIWCWAQARSTSWYPAITDGPHPASTGYQGIRYDGSWIGLAVLAALAGVVGFFVALSRLRAGSGAPVSESGQPS